MTRPPPASRIGPEPIPQRRSGRAGDRVDSSAETSGPDKPCFVHFAPGATHSPGRLFQDAGYATRPTAVALGDTQDDQRITWFDKPRGTRGFVISRRVLSVSPARRHRRKTAAAGAAAREVFVPSHVQSNADLQPLHPSGYATRRGPSLSESGTAGGVRQFKRPRRTRRPQFTQASAVAVNGIVHERDPGLPAGATGPYARFGQPRSAPTPRPAPRPPMAPPTHHRTALGRSRSLARQTPHGSAKQPMDRRSEVQRRDVFLRFPRCRAVGVGRRSSSRVGRPPVRVIAVIVVLP